MRPVTALSLLAPWLALTACGPSLRGRPDVRREASMKDISEQYVKLVLALGTHDQAYVDAYYGPPEWRKEAEAARRPMADIRADAERLVAELRAMSVEGVEPLEQQRRRFLAKQLEALEDRVDMLGGKKLSFDDESRALYDAVAPVVPEARFDEAIARIDALVPGDKAQPVAARWEAYRKSFIIPRDKLDAVFRAAIAECRARTARHIEMPAEESFTVEYVNDKPWGGYNWYKGGYHSVIQVNVDLPVFIDRAVDLACHEGYPGHHVYNLLIESELVRGRGWTELTVNPLFSPMSLIAEGSANYGIEAAFPGEERDEYERRVLYPLAGLDPSKAKAYGEILRLTRDLMHARNQAARKLIDGELDAAGAAAYLSRYELNDPERARKSVQFITAYRSYVINYNLGLELVRAWIERQSGPIPTPERRWEALEQLLTTPLLPSDLTR